MKHLLALLSITVPLLSSAMGDNPEFKVAPSAKLSSNGAQISFEVTEPCDVQVEVLSATGNIVRHLGGGMLGTNSPLPFSKGLKQSITWDGKDDFGRRAASGPFKIRVGLGLTASFDKILAWSGERIDGVRGICCGPDGTLYVIYGGQHYGHRRTSLISAFDRNGKYLRQVLPGPGGMPLQKRKGWPHATLVSGREVPVIWHTLSRAVNPGLLLSDRCFPAVDGNNRLLFVNSCGSGSGVTVPDFHGNRRIMILGTDGSVPKNYLGPEICEGQPRGNGCIAVSPDGKAAYVTAIGGGKVKRKPIPRHNVVYKVPLTSSSKTEVFAGKLKQQGNGTDGFNNPVGLATDNQGNVYVADHGNNRIAVFDPSGKHIKDIPAPKPWQVKVSRKTGAIYAVTENGAKLTKYGPLNKPTKIATLAVPSFKKYKISYNTMIALDDSQEEHILWLVTRWWHNHAIHQIVDTGDSLKNRGRMLKKNARPGINFTGGMAIIGNKLVTMTTEHGLNWNAQLTVFDTITGECERSAFKKKTRANEVVAGKDGNLYAIGGGWKKPHPVHRYNASFKGNPFPEANPIKGFWHGHTRTGGMFADRRGNVYLMGGDKYRNHTSATIRKYNPQGKLVDNQVVKLGTTYFGGLVLDSRGNVYTGVQVTEKGKPIPDWFTGKLPANNKHHRPGRAYRQYGAIVKFNPAGGSIDKDPAGQHYSVLIYGDRGPVTLKDAQWLRRGGEVPVRGSGRPDVVHCFCETTRFDIDFHDRLFVPDIHRFCVQVLDSAGNPVTLIGSYGNMDNQGPKSAHPEPAIPYGWPLVTQVVDGKLYVADLTNRRIVVAQLGTVSSETCAIK